MSSFFADRFIDSLNRLESHRDLVPMIALFGDGCEVGNVVVPNKFHGVEGAREFWTKYRDTFQNVRSVFHNRISAGDRIALEWTTEATGPDGKPLHYSGVSILEVTGDKISRFHAYFDPALLGRQMESAGASA
jgi:predicted ester cyclase